MLSSGPAGLQCHAAVAVREGRHKMIEFMISSASGNIFYTLIHLKFDFKFQLMMPFVMFQ